MAELAEGGENADYIEALVSERVRRHNAVIEQACEASLLSGEHGVRVEWDGDTTRAWVDPEVPYGQIHEHRLPPPHLFQCGTPPDPGEKVWTRDREYVVAANGLDLIPAASQPPVRVSTGERIAGWIMCPACLLPRFVPGHKFRGCER